MLDRIFSDPSYVATSRALDASSLRHQAIADNLANVNTPGYKRQEVQFENQLSSALKRMNDPCSPAGSNPILNVHPTITTDASTSMKLDGNNVDMEKEMSDLAENSVNYQVLAQNIEVYFSDLKMAIKGT